MAFRHAGIVSSLLLMGGLFSLAAGPAQAAVPSATGDVVVTWSDQKQKISGFGAAVVFFAKDMSLDDADFLFSPSRGLGLSLLRVSVGQDGTCPEIESAKKAAYYGVKVWASSWTPPAEWKTNNDTTAMPKAHLIASHYGDFATLIGDYIDWMAQQGIPLYAISPQNEPDYESSWDGCLWAQSELMTFIRDNLGPTLAARNQKTLIMAPDTAAWNNMDAFVTAILNDTKAKGYLSIVSTHPYSVGSLNYTKPKDNGKEFWETEVSQEKNPQDTPDPSITSALTMVSMIHDHIITTGMNAWHWWATIGPETLDDPVRQNPALIQNGVKYKRAYALGNFAKFVRPGWVRLGATEIPVTNIRVSAYRDPATNRLSIVAVNSGTSTRTQKFWVDGQNIGTITPYVTSDSANLEKQSALGAATNNFTFTLPARSIVTFANWDADNQGDPAEPPPPPPPPPDAGTDDDGGTTSGSGGSSGTGAGGSSSAGTGGKSGAGTGGARTGVGGGGVSPGTGGSGSDGSGGAQTPPPTMPPPGCACAVGNSGAPAGGLLAGLFLVALALARRGRRARR